MNEGTKRELTPELKRWIESWRTSLQEALAQAGGRAIDLAASGEALQSAPDDLWYAVIAGDLGEMSIRIPAASASALAKMPPQAAATEPSATEPSAKDKESVAELLAQVAQRVAATLSSAVGEVKFQVMASSAPSWQPAVVTSFRTTGETPFAVEIQISAALAKAAGSSSDATPEPLPSPQAANYERLMDVEMEVKLRFGARQMELRDVLALGAGSVVELDHNLDAPVDLLLDGRVIAQGDVVVVDGKYGLQVTRVLEPGPCA